jgi:beta-glucosidase
MIFKRTLTPGGAWGGFTSDHPLSEADIEQRASDLLARMSLDEKIRQMSGDIGLIPGVLEYLTSGYNREIYPAGENPRLGIPGIRFSDGPRGIVMHSSTCFPVSMARGASWDPALEERIGDAIGVEGRSQGANFFGGVCINLLRHPAWGRAQETYGEDPFLLGEMGAALVRGVQRHMMACVKHYACNSMENARFKVNVKISERTLREVYTLHFKRCVEEGAAAVMSAYNRVNGQWCGHHTHLLRDLLKRDWGFKGFIVSDFGYGVRDARAAALGGQDVEMPFSWHIRLNLKNLVERGEVPEAVVDDAVLRLLRAKLRFAHVGEPQRYRQEAVACPAHTALAREAAGKSMVLLQNRPASDGKPLLPFNPARFNRLAVIGELAARPNTGDRGSSNVYPPYVVTLLEGLRAAWSGGEVLYHDGKSPAAAAVFARQCGAALVVAGYTWQEEGEFTNKAGSRGGDRASLRLKPADEALIQAVAAANPNILVALVCGSAVITEAWREQVAGILVAWYSGMEGGNALADVLLGKVNPSGKLPCMFPKDESQLPFFDRDAAEISYDGLHGYRLVDQNDWQPAFAFGFGLSYTTFQFGELRLDQAQATAADVITASLAATNTGALAGDEVVQLYVSYPDARVERPPKDLKGFEKVHLEPGETCMVQIRLPVRSLARYDESAAAWVVDPGRYQVLVGSSSRAEDLQRAEFEI